MQLKNDKRDDREVSDDGSDSNYSNEEKYNELNNEDKSGFDNTQKKFKKAVRIVNFIKKKK